ncbi:MAG: hypothetical protein ABIW76_05925 [Fibrobacteria bacterium]
MPSLASMNLKGFYMLGMLCAILLGLWLLSMATSMMLGGLAHLFLIAAIALILVLVWRGRSTV